MLLCTDLWGSHLGGGKSPSQQEFFGRSTEGAQQFGENKKKASARGWLWSKARFASEAGLAGKSFPLGGPFLPGGCLGLKEGEGERKALCGRGALRRWGQHPQVDVSSGRGTGAAGCLGESPKALRPRGKLPRAAIAGWGLRSQVPDESGQFRKERPSVPEPGC